MQMQTDSKPDLGRYVERKQLRVYVFGKNSIPLVNKTAVVLNYDSC